MSDSAENKSKKVQPVYVLLPFCVELETDVFLNILRSFVSRSRLDDDVVALRAGMSNETFYVKSNDLLANWKELDSESQRIRQIKLLGFWAARNFPALGTKLLGEQWQAPQGKTVEVKGNSMMSADEIDAVIFRKMKLRIIELNVCRSTLKEKLNHFVKSPISPDKSKWNKISAKIKSFELKIEHTELCWKTLKFGNASMTEQTIRLCKTQHNRTTTTAVKRGISSANSDSRLERVAKLSRVDVDDTNRTITEEQDRLTNNQNGSQLVPVIKRVSVKTTTRSEEEERGTSSANGSKLMHAAELPDANADQVSTIESFRIDLLKMRKEIRDISKRSNHSDHHVECPQMTLKQKDEEIAELKASVANRMKENDVLNGHIERITGLASVLKKGLVSSSKLYAMLESSSQKQIKVSIEKLGEAEKLKLELSEENGKLKKELNDLKHYVANVQSTENRIQDVIKKLSEVESVNVEMSGHNAKLLQELDDAKNYAATVESLMKNVTEVETDNVQLSEKNEKLQQELDDAKNCAAIGENRIEDLKKDLSKGDQVQLEMSEKIKKLDKDINNCTNYATNKEKELIEAMKANEELKRVNVQLSEKNEKLQQELDDAKKYAAIGENRIEDLKKDLGKGDQIQLEMYEKIKKLDEEVNNSKNYAANKEKELIEAMKANEELNYLKSYADSMVAQLQSQIENIDEKESNSEGALDGHTSDLKNKNEADVNELKSEGALDEHESNLKSESDVETFETDDPIVRKCRPHLLKLRFGWIKFYKKQDRLYPGFLYPPDSDGICRAQKINKDGYPSSTKFEHFGYNESINDGDKDEKDVAMLNEFNNKFKTSFV